MEVALCLQGDCVMTVLFDERVTKENGQKLRSLGGIWTDAPRFVLIVLTFSRESSFCILPRTITLSWFNYKLVSLLLELSWVGDSLKTLWNIALMTRDVNYLVIWQVRDIDFTKINSRWNHHEFNAKISRKFFFFFPNVKKWNECKKRYRESNRQLHKIEPIKS